MSAREQSRRDAEFDRLLTVELHTVQIDGTDLYTDDAMRKAYEMGKRHGRELDQEERRGSTKPPEVNP